MANIPPARAKILQKVENVNAVATTNNPINDHKTKGLLVQLSFFLKEKKANRNAAIIERAAPVYAPKSIK